MGGGHRLVILDDKREGPSLVTVGRAGQLPLSGVKVDLR